jgi:hypothetical protein
VASPTYGTQTFLHLEAGRITLNGQMLSCADDFAQAILVLTTASGSEDLNVLKILEAGRSV